MGVLHDLILAGDDDLEKILSGWLPEEDYISAKFLDPVAFGQLHAILTKTVYDNLTNPYLTPFNDDNEDGPWITLVSQEFITTLAELEAPERQRVALEWATVEEITLWKFPDTESLVAALLTDMQNLARRALLHNKKLFLRSAL